MQEMGYVIAQIKLQLRHLCLLQKRRIPLILQQHLQSHHPFHIAVHHCQGILKKRNLIMRLIGFLLRKWYVESALQDSPVKRELFVCSLSYVIHIYFSSYTNIYDMLVLPNYRKLETIVLTVMLNLEHIIAQHVTYGWVQMRNRTIA